MRATGGRTAVARPLKSLSEEGSKEVECEGRQSESSRDWDALTCLWERSERDNIQTSEVSPGGKKAWDPRSGKCVSLRRTQRLLVLPTGRRKGRVAGLVAI